MIIEKLMIYAKIEILLFHIKMRNYCLNNSKTKVVNKNFIETTRIA